MTPAKTTGLTLPEFDTELVADAMRSCAELQAAKDERTQSLAATQAIMGTTQATATTARLSGGHSELLDTGQDRDLYRDSTVPIVAAR